MAMGAEDWKSSLGRSVDDVFFSLSAFLFAAPLVVLASISAKRASARIPDIADPLYASTPLAALIVADLTTFALDWGASLALLLMLARATGAGKQAADLVVGYNWIQPIVVAAQLPAIALIAASASRTLGGLVGLPALALTLALLWGVVRRGLGAQPAPAAAIVVILVLVGVVIDLIAAAALRAVFVGQS